MRQSTLGSRCDETGDISFEFDIFHEFPRRNLTGDGHAHRVEIHMPRHRLDIAGLNRAYQHE